MPKQLTVLSLIILSLCAIGSSLLNFQTAGALKSQREFALLDGETFKQIDWIAILSQLPQYKKVEINADTISADPNNTQIADVQISDGHIIGIVVGQPNSVLVYVDQSDSLEPLQLTVGEGWLPNWVIKQINPDSVEWSNQLTQQSYTQMLFNHSNSEQKNLTTSKSRIK